MNTTLNADALRRSWASWLARDLQRSGPYVFQLLWTALFSLAIALAFTVAAFVLQARDWETWSDPGRWALVYGRNLAISACIAFFIHGLFELAGRLLGGAQRLRRLRMPGRLLFYAGVPILGVGLGWPLGMWLAGMEDFLTLRQVGTSLALALVLTAISYQWFSAQARRLEAERQASEAQLRLLQAQIEPHFLFNTLANVQSLMEHDLPKAQAMLQSFTAYLRASLTALRSEQSPLAQELELAQNYLALLQTRMEERLRFSITADDAALAQQLPPLLLQPLVENAVHHGLEPSMAGGSVHLRAQVQGSMLVLEVQDDGLGLSAPTRPDQRPGQRRGQGLGLANVRQRLQVRYGDAARLELLPAQPGTLVRISLPLELVPAGSTAAETRKTR